MLHLAKKILLFALIFLFSAPAAAAGQGFSAGLDFSPSGEEAAHGGEVAMVLGGSASESGGDDTPTAPAGDDTSGAESETGGDLLESELEEKGLAEDPAHVAAVLCEDSAVNPHLAAGYRPGIRSGLERPPRL